MNFYRSSVAADQLGEYATTYACSVNNAYQYTSAYARFNRNTTLTNQGIVVGNYVNNCAEMLRNAFNFNGTVSLGRNVVNCYNMLRDCYNYNSNLTIPANAEDCTYMLTNCNNYDSNVYFAGTASRNCTHMFYGCSSFNKQVNLSEGITNCSDMFNGSAYNQELTIPSTVTNCANMLNQCNYYAKNIYFNGNIESCNTFKMLNGRDNSRMLNVFYNGNYNIWNSTLRKIMSATAMGLTMMNDGNGYYDPASNVYFYNNYCV